MKLQRLFGSLAIVLTLDSCKLAEAPFSAVGRVIQSTGRLFHLNSEATKKAGDFRLEAKDVRDAVAGNEPFPRPPTDGRPELANR
jgi:hypothetical protein